MDHAQELWDVEQVKRLKSRYFRSLDSKDWVEFSTLFAPDCSFEFSGHWTYSTSEDFVEHIKGLPLATTVHLGHDPLVDLVSPTAARGSWTVADTLYFTNDPGRRFQGFGRYEHTFRKIEDAWLFDSWSFVRLLGTTTVTA